MFTSARQHSPTIELRVCQQPYIVNYQMEFHNAVPFRPTYHPLTPNSTQLPKIPTRHHHYGPPKRSRGDELLTRFFTQEIPRALPLNLLRASLYYFSGTLYHIIRTHTYGRARAYNMSSTVSPNQTFSPSRVSHIVKKEFTSLNPLWVK